MAANRSVNTSPPPGGLGFKTVSYLRNIMCKYYDLSVKPKKNY